MKRVKVFDDIEKAKDVIKDSTSILVIINNKKICLTRHKETFYASDDKCPHQFESLSKGSVNYIGEIICPLHSYRYDLKTGRECQMRTADLKTYPVEINNNGLFITI